MATLNKDFKIKSGLIVEGSTATVGGNQVLTENVSDNYILDLIGGETLVKSVDSAQLQVSGSGQLSVKDNVFDASGAAATAETNANNYTTTALESYTPTQSLDTTIDGYGYLKSADLNGYATESYVDQAETDANAYADALINDASNSSTQVWSSYKTSTEIGLAQSAAEQFATDAVADLVGSAPALLDTLQELAAAMDNDPEAINSLQSIAAGKQDALTAGNGIDIDGSSNITVDPTDLVGSVADGSFIELEVKNGDIGLNKATLENHTNTLYDATGTAQGLVDALDTDDIEEGVNSLYYTDSRAKDAAVALLTGATLNNIAITGTANSLVITAENGVADSTTTDLDEGTNLYFTDERAIDAIDTVSITPGAVTINNWRKEESEQLSVANASTVNVHSFGYPYESAKYLVRVVGWDGGVKHSQITEVLMTVDGNNNIAMTEYGNVHTSTNPLATFSADVVAGSFTLTATTVVAGCEIIVAATLLSWND